jgi:nucleotide-binding universal stress UspA family protein
MLQRILVPLDGSELATGVLPYVKEISQRCDPVDVILLHVVRPPSGHTAAVFMPLDSDFPGARMPGSEVDLEIAEHPIYREQEMASLRGEVEAALTPLARDLREAGISTRIDVAFGRPAQQIVTYAEREEMDLIAMSTHGRSGVSRWILGSVADKVLRGTNLPVMLVRPPGVARAPVSRPPEIEL